MCFKEMLNLWKNVLMNPKKTFKKEKKKSNLGLGAYYIVIAGIIGGIISAIVSLNWVSALFFIFFYPLLSFVGWLINSGIYYVFARLLGGKGNYTKQSYLIALYVAPLSIITAIILLIPTFGVWLSLLVTVYSLYLLTFALKEAHSYSTGRAVMTWLIPLSILLIIIAIGIGLFLMYYVSSYGSTIPEISQLLV
jgi:hypothetical protein